MLYFQPNVFTSLCAFQIRMNPKSQGSQNSENDARPPKKIATKPPAPTPPAVNAISVSASQLETQLTPLVHSHPLQTNTTGPALNPPVTDLT